MLQKFATVQSKKIMLSAYIFFFFSCSWYDHDKIFKLSIKYIANVGYILLWGFTAPDPTHVEAGGIFQSPPKWSQMVENLLVLTTPWNKQCYWCFGGCTWKTPEAMELFSVRSPASKAEHRN